MHYGVAMPKFIARLTWPERGLFLLLAIFALVAFRFSFVESIWTDESTQLSGITLDVYDMIRWLANLDPNPFPVPPDRQPPLSYLLMKLISALGGGELALRWLGIALVVGSAIVLFRAVKLVIEPTWALFSVAFFILRPEMALLAVDIRPYPALLFLTTVALYYTIQASISEERVIVLRSWALALTAGVMASYDHFFGLIVLGCVSLSALANIVLNRFYVRSIILLITISAIATLPVLVFVFGAFGISQAPSETSEDLSLTKELIVNVIELVRLGYWTVGGGPVIGSNLFVLVVALLSTLALLPSMIGGVWQAALRVGVNDQRSSTIVFVFAAAGVGVLILIAARFAGVESFAILSEKYNIWLWPVASLAFGFAASVGRKSIVVPAALTLIVARSMALLLFNANASHFSHSASDAMDRLITEYDVEAILYEEGTQWAAPYFGTNYRRTDNYPQFVVAMGDEGLSFQRIKDGGALRPLGAPKVMRVIVARYENMDQASLRQSLRGSSPSLSRGELAETLLSEGATLQATVEYPSFIGARLDVLDLPTAEFLSVYSY